MRRQAIWWSAVRDFSQAGIDEGDAEHYIWYVLQKIAGLLTALGGRDVVIHRLDKYTSPLNVGSVEPYMWAGNEPNFSVPLLYNYLGQPLEDKGIG